MMKDAGHFDQIKRLRISDKDLAPLTAAYDVRTVVEPLECSDIYSLIFYFRPRFPNSKSPIDPIDRCPE